MQCSNHLKQLGIALHNYQDTYGDFPSGFNVLRLRAQDGGEVTPGSYSAVFRMMPYMELQALYGSITGNSPASWGTGSGPSAWNNGTTDASATANHPGVGGQIAVFSCPSDGKRPSGATAQSFLNYSVCIGDVPWWNAQDGSVRRIVKRGGARGLFYTRQHATDDTLAHGPYSMASITDGTSNTIAFSETIVGTADNVRLIRGGLAGIAGSSIVTGYMASSCSGTRSTTDSHSYGGTSVTGYPTAFRGTHFLDGRATRAVFSTVLPPNSPSCIELSPGSGNYHENNRSFLTANSYHTGGVQVGLCDGSVRFVTDTVNHGNLNTPLIAPANDAQVASNPYPVGHQSYYGVWGAIGSIDGGETVSL